MNRVEIVAQLLERLPHGFIRPWFNPQSKLSMVVKPRILALGRWKQEDQEFRHLQLRRKFKAQWVKCLQ